MIGIGICVIEIPHDAARKTMLALWIRDSLSLNVLMPIRPIRAIRAIRTWQLGK